MALFSKKQPEQSTIDTAVPAVELAPAPEQPAPSYGFTRQGDRFPISKLVQPIILKTSGSFELRTGEIITTDTGLQFEFVSLVPMTGKTDSYMILLPVS